MTDGTIDLSRRKLLGAVGVVGVAGAGAGMGTSALYSDTEEFQDNSIEAGTLDLIVDYRTSVTQDGVDTGSTTGSGELNGDPVASGEYTIKDLKPGDSGRLVFDPKVVDNPGWVWVGSQDGLAGAENGQTEPEETVDATGGDPGSGAGELAEAIQVTVRYADPNGPDTRQLNNPADYTLGDLLHDLESGFLLDGAPFSGDPSGKQAYPSSADGDDQTGPSLVVEWNLPLEVGNEVQSDSVAFDIAFLAVQERNNPNPSNPFVDLTVGPSGTGTTYEYNSIQAAVDAASAGDVIAVAPNPNGYSGQGGQVTVDENDILLAATAGPGQTPVNARLVASADGVTVCGFTVSPPSATSNQTDEAIRVSNSPDGVTIRGNVVEDFSRSDQSGDFYGVDGINVFGGSASDPVENVTVVNNVVRRIENDVIAGAAGISVQGNVDGATVQRNRIRDIGRGVTSYAFGVVVRGSGNVPNDPPRNVNVVDNDIGDVLATTGNSLLGVGLSVEADGTGYIFRDNSVENVNIGVEIKAAATESTFVGNDIGPIDNSVNPSGPPLYLGDQTGSADVGAIIGANGFDVPVTSGPTLGPYTQTIVPQ